MLNLMYKVREANFITQEIATRMLDNLQIVASHKQKNNTPMVGPHGKPTEFNPSIGDIVGDVAQSGFFKSIYDSVKNQYLAITGTAMETLPSNEEGVLGSDSTHVTLDFWHFINDKIHVMRAYANYFNALACSHCYSTCYPYTSCTCGCACTCTGGTTAAACITKSQGTPTVFDGNIEI